MVLRAGPHEGWPHSVTAGALPPGSRKVVAGAIGAGDGTCGVMRGACGGYREGRPSASGWARR